MTVEAPDSAMGQRAPGLALPRADGGMFSLDEFRGRPSLLIFLSHAA